MRVNTMRTSVALVLVAVGTLASATVSAQEEAASITSVTGTLVRGSVLDASAVTTADAVTETRDLVMSQSMEWSDPQLPSTVTSVTTSDRVTDFDHFVDNCERDADAGVTCSGFIFEGDLPPRQTPSSQPPSNHIAPPRTSAACWLRENLT